MEQDAEVEAYLFDRGAELECWFEAWEALQELLLSGAGRRTRHVV